MSWTGRQKALAALLLLLLAVLLLQRLGFGGSAGDDGSELRGAGRGAGREVTELRLADLEPHAGTHGSGRDPFRYGQPPPPPGPTPEELEAARRAAEARARELAAQEAARVAAAAVPPEPQPPPFTLRYLGSFGPAKRRIAVFSDGKLIYNALQGQVLGGKFIVHRIGLESVDIRFVDFPEVPPQRLAAGG